MAVCKKCGAQMDDGVKFCAECGAKYEPPVQEKPAQGGKKFCPNCGNELKGNARFCAKCGTSIAADASVPTQAVATGNVPTVQQNALQQPNQQMVPSMNQNQGEVLNLNFSGLDPYYQEEFQKIYESGETYKGKFNRFACGFSWIWLLSKGVSKPGIAHALFSFIAGLFTAGIAAFEAPIVCGLRGTWMYYNSYVKHKDVYY